MQEHDLEAFPLQQLAFLAAHNAIRGSSLKRNSLLKPLDILLKELDRSPHPEEKYEQHLLRAGTKELIFDHLERIAKDGYTIGRTKRSRIDEYVNLFFDGVLGQTHHGKVNALLERETFLRAAYLFWVREALAEMFVAKGLAKNVGQASDQIQEQEEEASSDEEAPDEASTDVSETHDERTA